MRERELLELIPGTYILIAGTEPITAKAMDVAPELRLIAGFGIGLDNVDLGAARKRGIAVTYTPDAPAPAVAELTIGLILTCHMGSMSEDCREAMVSEEIEDVLRFVRREPPKRPVPELE